MKITLEEKAKEEKIREKATTIVHNLGEHFDNRCDEVMGCNHGAVGYFYSCPDLTITLFENNGESYGCIIELGCYETTPSGSRGEVYSDRPPCSLNEKIRKKLQGIQPITLYNPGRWEELLDKLFIEARNLRN